MGHMAKLAAGSNVAFSVKIERRAWVFLENGTPIERLFADEIRHDGVGMTRDRSERPACDSANVILELADRAGLHGPVPRIMHARRDLVYEQRLGVPLRHNKKFNADDAAIVESGGDA